MSCNDKSIGLFISPDFWHPFTATVKYLFNLQTTRQHYTVLWISFGLVVKVILDYGRKVFLFFLNQKRKSAQNHKNRKVALFVGPVSQNGAGLWWVLKRSSLLKLDFLLFSTYHQANITVELVFRVKAHFWRKMEIGFAKFFPQQMLTELCKKSLPNLATLKALHRYEWYLGHLSYNISKKITV